MNKYSKLDLGTVEAVFNKLGGIKGAQAFLRGQAEVVVKKHLIDCDKDPFGPSSWEVVEHRKCGQFEWDPKNVKLYLSKNQQNSKVIEGNKLRKELVDEPVLNTNVLDYLLAHPELIPQEWKGKYVFFWGTIYCLFGAGFGLRYLCWGGSRWDWGGRWLGYPWGDQDPAALRAK